MGRQSRWVLLGLTALALTGCSSGTVVEVASTPTATMSPTKQWIESDEFDVCRDLYASVPGSSDSPHRTCQAMAQQFDVDDLIADFGSPTIVESFRADLVAQVAALATPTPEPVQPEAAPYVISEQARHVLDVNLGAGFAAAPAIKDQYCTMSDATLASTAGVLVGMYRDIVEADVIAYINEVCGR